MGKKAAQQNMFSFYFVSGNFQEVEESWSCMTEKFICRISMWN